MRHDEMWKSCLRWGARRMKSFELADNPVRAPVAEQVELRSDFPLETYLSLYHDIDIALDTFPWSGHTTECEALWMGVPVVTLRGNRHAGRLVASILTSAGLPQFIANSTDQYIQIAKALASDIDQLSRYRATLREQTAVSALCNGDQFTRSLEAAYRQIWQDWCRTNNHQK